MCPKIEELLSRPAITPEELADAKLLPIARNGIYDALNRGEIEHFRVGRKFVIPTAPLRRKLGIEGA